MESEKLEDVGSRRRKRGILLSASGFGRLNTARRSLEFERNSGARLSLERLSAEIGLSSKTLAKVLGRSAAVDLRTLEAVFTTFGLDLHASDHEPVGGSAQPGTLPLIRTALVGRSAELARLGELVADHRLVTLTGPGGIGKTRVAIALASTVVPAIAERVVYVDLSALVDPAMVASAVLGAFGLSQPRSRAVEALAATITGDVLCVVDNCEHLLGAVADLVNHALTVSRFFRVLATSREPLGITGERVVRIAPLALPAAGICDAREALRSPAVALFVDRTKSFDDTFVFDERLVPCVIDIVRRLDGLPLAIELAAARSDVMTLPELQQSLSERLDLLADERPSFAKRHRSVRAMVDWSYQLLSIEERRVFRACGVFMGDFDIAAVEAVAAGTGTEAIVGRLVRKSLLVRAPHVEVEATRVRLLELVRHVALEELRTAGEAGDARAAHAHHFAFIARRETQRLRGDDRLAAIGALTREESNLREALEWALQVPDASDLAVAMAGDLARYWDARASYVEGESWLERVVAKVGADAIACRVARVFEGLALMRYRNGRFASAWAAAERALEIDESLGDRTAAIGSRNVLALTHLESERSDVARGLLETNLRDACALGLAREESVALENLGRIASDFDDEPDVALSLVERSLEAARRCGVRSFVAAALFKVTSTASSAQAYARALACAREGLAAARGTENRSAACAFALGAVSAHLRLASVDLAAVEVAFLLDEGALCDPDAQLFEGLISLAAALAARGLEVEAARTLGAAARVAVALPESQKRSSGLDAALRALTAQAGKDAARTAFESGQTISLAQTLDAVLGRAGEVRG